MEEGHKKCDNFKRSQSAGIEYDNLYYITFEKCKNSDIKRCKFKEVLNWYNTEHFTIYLI